MTDSQGMPIWYELITDDPDAAERFYGAVLGWRFSRPPGGLERDYRIAETSEAPVAGLMRRPEGMAMPPSWFVYFAADDVDATASAAKAGGGAVRLPGTDIPGVGRLALLADPQGIAFYVMRRAEGSGTSRAFLPMQDARPGHAIWNELSTSDPDAALSFYGALLGLRQEGSMPMGPLGDYRFLQVGQTPIGALMGEMPNGRTAWQVYFTVPDIDLAAARIRDAGGTVVQEPMEIPGGAFSLIAEDRQGVRFGLVGQRR